MLWYALYAWDQALEMLWEHICQLVCCVPIIFIIHTLNFPWTELQELDVMSLRKMEFTHELHRIRAHLLHYASLLDDFTKSVDFVDKTENPAMKSDPDKENSKKLLTAECSNLMIQIRRLTHSRQFWDQRLQNIMNLVDLHIWP
jgi:hypothetical protein